MCLIKHHTMETYGKTRFGLRLAKCWSSLKVRDQVRVKEAFSSGERPPRRVIGLSEWRQEDNNTEEHT